MHSILGDNDLEMELALVFVLYSGR